MTVETDTRISKILASLGIEDENPGAFAGQWLETSGERVESLNPATGETIAAVRFGTAEDYEKVAAVSVEAFREWQTWTAPKRGEIVRQLGDELRRHKEDWPARQPGSRQVLSKGAAKVQEMIDMARPRRGMSRQLYGLSMHSEGPSPDVRAVASARRGGHLTAFTSPCGLAWNACGSDLRRTPCIGSPRT